MGELNFCRQITRETKCRYENGLGHTKSLVKGQEREGECPRRLEQRVSHMGPGRNSYRDEDKLAVRGMQWGKVHFPKEGSENPTQAWI